MANPQVFHREWATVFRVLSAPQVCRLVGISYRQLDYWCRLGLIRPVASESRGSGVARRFDEAQLPAIRLAAHLMRLGATAQTTARVVEFWDEQPLEAWHGLLFVDVDGRQSFDSIPPAAWVVDLDACAGSARLELVAV